MIAAPPHRTAQAPAGFRLIPGALSVDEQARLLAAVRSLATAAPFRRYVTPGGRRMSVEMTSFGPLGWTSSAAGYRYSQVDPASGEPWPAMPAQLRDLWRAHAGPGAPEADSALVNRYRGAARMALHQDRDEDDLAAPVLSVSLGDTAVFRLGGPRRSDPTGSFRLASGDVCVLGGEARTAFHGVDRVIAGSSRLVPGGGRINITMRGARA